jgi:hypothetical protein
MSILEVVMFCFFALLFIVPVVLTLLSLRKQARRPSAEQSQTGQNTVKPATRKTIGGSAQLAGGARRGTN